MNKLKQYIIELSSNIYKSEIKPRNFYSTLKTNINKKNQAKKTVKKLRESYSGMARAESKAEELKKKLREIARKKRTIVSLYNSKEKNKD